jgi:chromosome segregation ATPase
MSTAGKVLTVLSMLLMLVWIVLISGVAQLNTDSARRVDELRKKAEGLKEQVVKARQDATEAHASIVREQEARDREVALARVREARAELMLTEARESLSRRQFLVEKAAASLASAQEDLTLRNQEKVALEKAKADGAATVDKTRGENAERLGQLTRLRDEFQKTRQQNVGAIDSRRGPNRRATQPVSFSR